MTRFSKTIATGRHVFGVPCCAQARDERTVYVDGLTRGLIWDRRTATADDLGIDYPKALLNVTATGTGGASAGTYYVGYRWLDRNLQPGSLSVLNSVTAVANDRFYYGSITAVNRFQDAISTRISASHKGYVQLWRSAVGDSSIVYTVYGVGTAMTVSATENDEGYSKYTISDIGGVSPVTALIPGDVVVISGHTVGNQDGQQTILKVLIDDKKIVTDKGYFGAGTATATERLFYMSYKGDLTSHADNGGSAQFTTATKHKLAVNSIIEVTGAGAAVPTYNTVHRVVSVQSPFVFTSDIAFDAGTLGTPVYQLIGYGKSTAGTGDTLTDAQLTASSNISMAITARDAQLVARRQNPPPKHKAVAVFFRSRMWYAVDVAYGGSNHAGTAMTVAIADNSPTDYTITGTNTDFRSDMVGRYLYMENETEPLEIQSVTSSTVMLVHRQPTQAGASPVTGLEFKICPKPEERNKIYYSEPDEPESVPATNVVYLEENTNDNDVIVGLAPHGAVLYAFKERHTYRISFGRQPKIDADPTLAFSRGALNHRCIAVFEDSAYVIDYAGIYSVSLWGSDQLARNGIDHDIKPLLDFVYDGKLGLDQARNAFTVVDPERRQVRFFLATSSLASEYSYDTTLLRPKACLVYNIDTKTWDVEGYVQQLGGGCCAPVSGRMRVFMAGMKDRVYSMKDNVAESGVVHNSLVTTYTSGTPSLTDSDATFGTSEELVNAPVAIVDGTGKFQVRRVVSHTATVLTLDKAFDTALDTTSEYVTGGVIAKFKTGAFAFPDSYNSKKGDSGNKRGMRIAYQPFSDTFDVRFYLNHESTPFDHKIPISEGMGITTTANSPNVVVDATSARSALSNAPGYGVVEIGGGRLQGESYGNRWLAVELRCFRGLAKPKFYGMEIMGVIPHPGSGEK